MTGATVKLIVEGMSCNHCVMSVQNALQRLDGVKRVKIDLESKIAEIDYEPGAVNLQAITETIENQGYKVV